MHQNVQKSLSKTLLSFIIKSQIQRVGSLASTNGIMASRRLSRALTTLTVFLGGLYLGNLQHQLTSRQEAPVTALGGPALPLSFSGASVPHYESAQSREIVKSPALWETQLADAQQETKRLRSQIKEMEKQVRRSRYQSSTFEQPLVDSNPRAVPNPHWVCRQLSTAVNATNAIPSASFLWNTRLKSIHAASQLKVNDPRYYFSDFTAQLLAIVAPRLSRSSGHDADGVTVQYLLDRIQARYEYLHAQGPIAEPVKIVVLGGSVLVGRNCRKLCKDLGLQLRMPQRECTWAHRLGVFLNVLVPDIFRVTKIAMGGTNTAVGTTIWKYDLLPPEARQPDVVINAYSTNDMHILTALEASSGNQTLRDRVFVMLQDFVREVLVPPPLACANAPPPPLFLHVDDYLGNEQRAILATTELRQSVDVLAAYYIFPTVSYADVIRDLVYGDTAESWFSPEGWYVKGTLGMQREIHPGMGMHIVMVWVIAFNLLHVATTHCSREISSRQNLQLDYDRSLLARDVPLQNGPYTNVRGKPNRLPESLPPPLTSNTTLETISIDWKQQSTTQQGQQECTLRDSRCIFSWVSGLSLQQNNRTWILEYFNERTVGESGWNLDDHNDKIGFVPSALGDSVVLEWKNVTQPVLGATFFTMRSYGDTWQDSRIVVIANLRRNRETSWQHLANSTLIGFHNKNTSEMYTEPVFFDIHVEHGDDLRIQYTLMQGKTFKMMGLAVCS